MINYINQNRGRLVGRNNNVCPPLIFAFDTIAELSFQFIDDRQQIQHLDPSELSGLYFAGSLKLGEQSYNLLFLSKDYTIENDTVTFSTETYTIPYLEKIRKPNTEIWIEMGQISLDKKRVLMRSNALAFPRCYSSGNDPLPIDTENFYTKEETQELLAQNLAESKDYTDSKIAEIDLDSYATDADLQAAKTELEGDIALKQDKITSENKLPYSLISDTPAIPTKTSELTNDSGFQTAQDVQNAISGKADTSALNAHTSDNTIHVTAADKTAWNGKLDPSALNGYATEQYVDGQVSGKADQSALTAHTSDTEIHTTALEKAAWNAKASEADLQIVSGAVDEKLEAPSGGTAGQVLTKTETGSEWADSQGGEEVNPAYVELEDKTVSTPATFEVDFNGKQIQKYSLEDAASGSIAFTVKNSGASGDGYAPTVELQIPVSGEISTITLPEGAQVVDMPASLTGELSNDRIKKGITYHDLVFRNEKNFAGHWQTYVSHGYSFQELQEYDYFWLEAREDDSTVSCDNFNASYNLSSSFDKLTWTALTGSTIVTGVSAGTKIYFIGNTTTLGSTSLGAGWYLYSDKKYAIGGKILSLYSEWIEPVTLTNDNDLSRWQKGEHLLEECSVDFGPVKFTRSMFHECSNLSALSDGFSCPNTTNTASMFISCYKLSVTPVGFSCQNATSTYYMFYNCSILSALSDGFSCPNTTNAERMFQNCPSLTTIGNNVKIANGENATTTDNTNMDKSKIITIGANFEWFTNATFDGTWDPALGIRNVFPNATSVGSGWRVYNHYDGE